jgi:hypothetical protein
MKRAVESVPEVLRTLVAWCEYAAESRTLKGVPVGGLRLMASGTSTKETNKISALENDKLALIINVHSK